MTAARARLFAVLGVLAWGGTLPWIYAILRYGLNQPQPDWLDFVVMGAVGFMTLAVALWICALCQGRLAAHVRVWLPGVMLGVAVYGWLAVSVVLHPQAAFPDWPLPLRFIVSVSPLLLEGWLLLSLPYYWRRFRG